MIIGVPKEVKTLEARVALTPAGVRELVKNGHQVLIEKNAGLGSAITDDLYVAEGAEIAPDANSVWNRAEMIMKVKEPLPSEYPLMRKGQILFTYLHLAASKECTDALVKSENIAIAYETVEVNGQLPLLAPMSEVAGRLSTQVGASALQKPNGGRGVLLGGVPGVRPGKVVVIGGGVADVTILDRSTARLQYIDSLFNGTIKTLMSNDHAIEEEVINADLVIGAVLIHGAKAPKLVSNALVSKMKFGSVLVDIAIDQGGCFEDSRATTHAEPTYKIHNSIFYCVANMPGAVPVASTYALTNATLPYAVAIANKGWQRALSEDGDLAKGLNVCEGKITYEAVAKAHGYQFSPLLH
jgi:alanine dehydrogenase